MMSKHFMQAVLMGVVVSWSYIAIGLLFQMTFEKTTIKRVHKIQPAKVASGSGGVTRHCRNPPAIGGLAGVNVKP